MSAAAALAIIDCAELSEPPVLDAADERAIEHKAQDLASAGFDDIDAWALEWIGSHPDVMRHITLAAIVYMAKPKDPDASINLADVVERAREQYINDSAFWLYRERAAEALDETGMRYLPGTQ